MAVPPNVELEAAKFLQKLILESKDEPTKLATKLYVILQHMRSSGKENSMPYHVISRAMETVINQHGLDIDALMSSRLPLTTGTQVGDSASSQFGGPSRHSDTSLGSSELTKVDAYASNRPPVAPSSAGHDFYQGSVSHLNSKSLDHESPSSFDTRSAKSLSEERRDSANREKANKNDNKKGNSKRKRADALSTSERQFGNFQPLDHGQFINMNQSSSQMEHSGSLTSAMRQGLRPKQETQHQSDKSLDSTNISNSLSRAPHSRTPEEIEVSSAHNALGLQQGGSLPSSHDVLNSKGLWNQNKLGLPFENSQVPRFSFQAGGGNSSAEALMHLSAASPIGSAGKVYGTAPGPPNLYAATETRNPNSEQFSSTYDKALEHEGGILHTSAHANNAAQGGMQNNVTDMTMLRSTGKLPISQAPPTASGMPFKEQHLKQLRAQCLVFLAFRNGLMPKKLHLDIALGNFFPKEDGPCKEMIDQKGKEQSVGGTSNTPDVTLPFGRPDNNPRDSERSHVGPSSIGVFAAANLSKEGDSMRRKPESEMQTRMIAQAQSHLPAMKGTQPDPKYLENMHTDQASTFMGLDQKMKIDVTGWAGNVTHDEASKVSLLPSSATLIETGPERKDNAPSQSFGLGCSDFQGSRHADALPNFQSSEQWKQLSRMDGGNHVVAHDDTKISNKRGSLNGNPSTVVETDHEDEDISLSTDLPPSPKYTTSEKWITGQQKRKLRTEQTWALKQQKTKQRIYACSEKLKDKVSSSEDISAKTRSVIELKKLQLLELQSRLRNDILNDFFKPIASDMDRLKSIKKHRIGRKSKQLEKYEQKMKEERQKRFRERQKDFFNEIEVHKERLEDVSKMRRERWKGFNKYAREFHKRKERVHREKIDRIQREKINLLKINDVEGYLRMVQDAKSDRVKQLLKETEKYLQKLGSKLQDAKVINRCFEIGMDDRNAGVMEKNEFTIENEDETDQAKHYLESNEKYYLMAHSIKENVAEQPSCLVGGKLREYQMNGLRWLVSLYNNHLNGILADEMGLGKTVQVISLICHLMETKNDRGPFLVVVPSSVLPGWNSEINFWAPSINKIVYSGPPEERRRLFKERILPQKFNVLLTTYEYLMNKHDRPKLSKLHWHYVIIDEGHRIKNASCKLNAELKYYRSSHRLLLTGTPLQNNLEELWALLNFLLPNIFNSAEDFSQWFNKPFETNGDSSPDEALLSEEENLLIINRLHQVLRPFVLRRLKHKVENELPEKIERLVRCDASAYQKLLMKRVEDNLGALGTSKARSVHNSVMELRNICNHPYLSQLHAEEVHDFIPNHYLPNIVRLCGKLEMLDRILPKLKATGHRVLLFSTMTRLLDVMEDYLCWKQYKYLRLDGHTCGGDRGALIDEFNKPDSPFFIFLLSIRAGGVGVNLQAADTVIIFDTDWNPQVDLQAQARAHRIGQKREVLVLRFETVQTVEEQVRAAAEHKLGVANQSITAGFFDNNTSAEDRREYLESLLRECKKEEAAPVLHDDALNDLIARSESEIDIFESIDKRRQEEEMAAWKLVLGQGTSSGSEPALAVPSRLVTDDDLKLFSEAMKVYDAPTAVVVSNVGVKRKGQYLGGLDTQHYGRGKRAREVRSYEEQWTEDEFEKMCQVDESPESPKLKGEVKELNLPVVASDSVQITVKTETVVPPFEQPVQPPILQLAQIPIPQPSRQSPVPQPAQSLQQAIEQSKDVVTTPSKRGRGRPKRSTTQISASQMVVPEPSRTVSSTYPVAPAPDSLRSTAVTSIMGIIPPFEVSICPSSQSTAAIMPSAAPVTQLATTIIPSPSVPTPDKRGGRKPAAQSGETPTPKRRGRKPNKVVSPSTPVLPAPSGTDSSATGSRGEIGSSIPLASGPDGVSGLIPSKDGTKEASSYSVVPVHFPSSGTTISSSPIFSSSSKLTGTTGSTHDLHAGATDLQPTTLPLLPSPNSQPVSAGTEPSSQPNNPSFPSVPLGSQSVQPSDAVPKQVKGRGRKGPSEVTPRRRGRKPQAAATTVVPDRAGGQEATSLETPEKKSRVSAGRKAVATRSKQQNEAQKLNNVVQAGLNLTSTDESSHSAHNKQGTSSSVTMESATVKVNQLDVPVSGDAIIMSTKVEVCHSSADNPSGIAIQNAGIKDVTFGETVTKKPEVNDFESKNNTAVLVSSTTFSERETDVRSVADGNLGGPTLSDTSTDLTENQSLELKKSLDLSTSETMIVTVSSDSKTNSASLTLGTDLVSDHVKLGCPSEKEGGENMEEVIKPLSDGSVSPTPEVHKPDESQSNAINVVQNSADPGKLTEESLRIHDDNGSTAHMGEKPLDAKGSVVNVTEKPVNYIEEKLVAVDNAMVDIRVSADSSKGEMAMDGKGAVVGSSGAKYSSDKTAKVKAEAEREFEAKESSESKDESEDPETRGGKQDLAAVGGTMEVAESSKPSKELGEVIHIGDRELHDIEETAVEIHQPTASRLVGHCDSQVEFDGAGGIEDDNKQGEFNSEGEQVGPKNLELKHDFAEVESIMTEGETKPSEEVEEEAFKEAAEHDRKEQQCVQLYATGEAVIEVGQSQTQAKGESEHIGKSDESSEQRDSKMEVQEGAPEFIGETHQLLEIGNIEGSKAEPSEEVDKVAQGAIENQKSGQGDGMLNAIRKPIPEIVDTKELLELGQTQAKQEPIGYTGDLEECSKQEEVHEDERSVPERTEERHDTAAGGTNGGGEVIPSEKVSDVHVGSGVLEATMNVTSEIKQAVADVFVEQIETPADENKPFEKIKDDFKETIQFEGMAQQRDEVSHVTGEAKFEQVTEGINVTQSRTEAEAKPDEKSDFPEAIEPESSRFDEGGIFHVIEETVTEIGPTKEEAAVGLGQTEEREVKADEKVEVVFQEATEHERKELTEEPVFESSQTQEELVKSCERVEEETSAEIVQRLEELPVEQCHTHVKDDCETSEKAEVFQKATEHERKESTEEPIIESIQTQDVLVKSCEIVEEETSAEILQRSEDLPVEQCQTHVKDDCQTSEKAEVFQQATEHERKELMEEPIIESIRTQEELVKSCEIVEEETSAEILQRSEELPVEQCQTHVKDDCVKDDCETSEKAEVFEQATEHERKESTEEPIIESIQTQEELVKSSEIVGEERSEELPVEQCQTHVKDDCETSEKAEVFQQATEHERKELTEEPIIESSQTQEELVKSCEIVEETSAEILQRSEELPVEQCQTHVEGDCETSEEVEVFQETKSTEEPIIGSSQTQEELVKSCEVIEETSAEIVQRSEELPVEQCQTHAKDDCETFEKFEVQKETKHESKESTEEPIIESSQTQEELVKSCELVKEQTSAEIVQRLEELPVEQCQNCAKDDCETSEKVEVFQETTEIMERLAEITKTSDELLDEQPQTQAEEVKHFAKAVAEIGQTKDESLGVVFETELKETVSHEEARNEELEKRGVEVDSTGESLAELGKLTEAVIVVPGEAQENEGASAGSSEDTLKTNNP